MALPPQPQQLVGTEGLGHLAASASQVERHFYLALYFNRLGVRTLQPKLARNGQLRALCGFEGRPFSLEVFRAAFIASWAPLDALDTLFGQ